MAKASPIQTNFTAGELSPRLDGRTDVAKYDNGCKTLENMVVHPQGGATRRPGTKFIGEVSDSSSEHRLIPFEFNVDQTYAVEFGDEKARLVTNDGFLLEEARTAFNTDTVTQVGWGAPQSVPFGREDMYLHFSEDGYKVYAVKITEAKDDFQPVFHTLSISIRQYTLESPHNLYTAGPVDTEKTWVLPDRHSSNMPKGSRRFHCGIFFGARYPLVDYGEAFYIWDGTPTADITSLSTSHTDCTFYQFDLNEAYDLSSLSDGDITSAADNTYYLGAQQTASRYPIPISGVSFNPPFRSVIEGEDYYYLSHRDEDHDDNDRVNRIGINPWLEQGGSGLFILVSHLLHPSAVISFGNTPKRIQRYSVCYIKMRTSALEAHSWNFIVDAFRSWPTGNNSTTIMDVSYPFNYIVTNTGDADANGIMTGIQCVATNNHWIMDANGVYAHEAGFTPAGENYDTSPTKYKDLSHSDSLDLMYVHDAPSYVFTTTFLSPQGNRNVIISKGYMSFFAVGLFPGIYNEHPLITSAFFKLSEVDDGSDLGINGAWGVINAHMQADGKKIWYSDPVQNGVTNVATSINLRYPYLGLSHDDSLITDDGDQDLSSTWYFRNNANNGYTSSFDYLNTNPIDSRVLEVVTPYSPNELEGIRYAQSADVLYLVHPDHKPQQFVRAGATQWACYDVPFTRGPMQDVNFDGSTMTASARTGSVTLTATSNTFQPTDVGRLVKVHDGYARITAVSNDINATATVLENEDGRTELMPSYTATTISAHEGDPSGTGLSHNDRFEDSAGNFIERGFKEGMRISVTGFTQHTNNNEVGALIVSVTADTILIAPGGDLTSESAGNSITIVGDLEADDEYRLGAFSETTGYPAVVTLYEQRLILGNTLSQPQTLFFSSAGLFTDFTPGIDATDAITYTLSSNQVNVIQYLVGARLLVVGTSGGEFSVSSGGTSETLTPTNIQIRRQSNYGGSTVQPFTIGSAVLFVQRGERKLRELVYDFDTDSYFAPDLTLLSEHLTTGLIKEIAWQQEPDGILWARLGDGSLIGLTYRREEEVIAWHKHTIGGSGFIESIISLPSRSGEDELYMIVKRTINGATKRYIERLSEIDNISTVIDPRFLDSHLTYSGAAVNSLSGLSHLEGETVSILANGAKHADKTVSSGSISLDVDVTDAVVGYNYSSTLETMRIDAGGTEGTSQGKTKRIRGVTARFLEASGAQIGPDTSNLKPIVFAEPGASATTAIPLYTGDKYIEFSGNYETDGFIVVKQDDPLPMTVLALMPLLQTFDR